MSEVKLVTDCPRSEFSAEFLTGMLNRMGMSYFKYGAVAEAYPEKVDAITSARDRIMKYLATGNTEWLIDAANFLMIEFMHPRHDNAHFEPTDSNESPGRVTYQGDRTVRKNEDIHG